MTTIKENRKERDSIPSEPIPSIDIHDICDIRNFDGPSSQIPRLANCEVCGEEISFRKFHEDGYEIPFNLDSSKHYCTLECDICRAPITYELCIPSLKDIPIDPSRGFRHNCSVAHDIRGIES